LTFYLAINISSLTHANPLMMCRKILATVCSGNQTNTSGQFQNFSTKVVIYIVPILIKES